MIALDTNVLVYAHRSDSPLHELASDALAGLAAGSERWVIPWPVVAEFVSVVTHPRIYDPPSTIEQALAQMEAWLKSPTLVLISEWTTTWTVLRNLLAPEHVVGPAIFDARIAALCLEHGVEELWTADRKFPSFPRLRVRNPW